LKLAFDDSLGVYVSPSPLRGKSGDVLISARRPFSVDKCGKCSESQLVTWKKARRESSALGKFRIKPGPCTCSSSECTEEEPQTVCELGLSIAAVLDMTLSSVLSRFILVVTLM
jgi:hypothetical protein